MSWYYADNNERRGPVEDAAFQELVRAGTVKPDTLVWREGMTNWIPYSQAVPSAGAPASTVEGGVRCAQCGGTFAATDVISIAGRSICAACKPRAVQQMVEGADAAGSTIDPLKLLEDVRARGGYRIGIGDVFGRAWKLVKANLGPCIGTTLLAYFVMMIAQQCLSIIGACLVQGPIFGGLFLYFLKQLRGEPAVVGDAFIGFNKPHFGQLALCGTVQLLSVFAIMAVILVPAFIIAIPQMSRHTGNVNDFPSEFPVAFVIAILVAIIPLMYLTMSWILSYAFIIDKGVRFWPAMELSRKLVAMNFGGWILLMIVNFLLAMAGVLALCVGLLFVMPVAFCVMAVIYEDIVSMYTGPKA